MRKANLVKMQKGFTLLEILLVVGILVVLGGAAAGYYGSAFRRINLESTTKTLMEDMRTAQAHAIQGEFAVKWGIHVVNGATDYYEVFRTPTNYADGSKVITQTVELPAGLIFTDPADSTSKDIVFSRTTGQTSAANIVLQDVSSGATKTITVTAIGLIQ